MAKKTFGKLAILAVAAGTAAAGISYLKKYRSFNKELDEDFHDIEDDGSPIADSTMNRNYVSLNADKDELWVAAGDMLNAARDVAGAAKNVVMDAAAIVADTTREAMSAAGDTAVSFKHTAADKAGDIKEAAEDVVTDVTDAAEDTMADVKDAVEDAMENTTEKVVDMMEQAATVITEDDSDHDI